MNTIPLLVGEEVADTVRLRLSEDRRPRQPDWILETDAEVWTWHPILRWG